MHKDEFKEWLQRQWAWSQKTFGTLPRLKGVIEHTKKEIAEIEREPLDREERIDLIMLAIDGYMRIGGTYESLMRDLNAKQQKNFQRTWPKFDDTDVPIEHIDPME